MISAKNFAAVAIGVAVAGGAHAGTTEKTDIDRLARGFIETLTEEDVAAFKKAAESDLPMLHFGAGSRVRQLYFGPHGEGRKALCEPGAYCDIDGQSMRIVERAWRTLNGVG
jgi:hypothetical protein